MGKDAEDRDGDARREWLAAQLRANLKRRKEQTRRRAAWTVGNDTGAGRDEGSDGKD